MKYSTIARFSTSATLLIVCVAAARADNWPQWRGPTLDGISKETNLPAEWGPAKNIVWKMTLPGMGSSTPAIWGDRIFLTSEDGDDLVVQSVSTAGKELWKRKVGHGKRRIRRDEGNEASPSPSTDGKHVYSYFGTGEFAAFDFEGNELWQFNAQDRFGKFKIGHGMHTTPLLYGDRLYLQLIHSNGAWVIALDKATGKTVWKVERPSDGYGECKEAYASIGLWPGGKDAYLIVHGNDYATGHTLDDGREIWRLGDLNSTTRYNAGFRLVSSPVATADLIVVPTAKNGPVVGIKPDAKGKINAGDAFEQWRRRDNTPDVPSPLVVDGLVYLCRENGTTYICMDAKTGKEHYNKRIHSSRYRASPVYVDGKIILTARDGTCTVVKAGPTFETLAINRLPDEFTASPAVSNGRIYLRGFQTLYAIGAKGE